jgi:UDP:flavonoid glycosyltransferase YjiC (YdhE family)
VRILFSSSPLTGHLLPMLPLAAAARRAGHQVIIATGPDLRAEIERRGFTAWAVGPSKSEIDEVGVPRPPGPGASDEEILWTNVQRLFINPSAARAAALIERTARTPVDVVVQELYELGASYLRPTTGKRLVHGLGADFPDFIELAGRGHAEVGSILGRPDAMGEYLAAPYVDPFPPLLHPPHRPWRDVRPLRPDAGEVPAGAALPESFVGLPHSRTVYLTMGTVYTSAQGWRGLLEAVADVPVNFVATTGNALDPGDIGPLPRNVAVERFVPQALLLPTCSAVVCHAGAGTALGALAFGLPLVLLPMGADQFQNAAAVASAGAGIVLDPEAATPAAIRAALDRVLDDDSYRRAAGAVARSIAGLPTADDVLAAALSGAPTSG